jgi:hypothetical protein
MPLKNPGKQWKKVLTQITLENPCNFFSIPGKNINDVNDNDFMSPKNVFLLHFAVLYEP